MTPQQNAQKPGYKVVKYGESRYWAVVDATGALVCVTVYKRGAEEVVRRLRGWGRQGGSACSSAGESRPAIPSGLPAILVNPVTGRHLERVNRRRYGAAASEMGEVQQPLALTRIYRRRGPPLQFAGVRVAVQLHGSDGVRRLRHR